MSQFLPVQARGTVAIAICPRCSFKVQYASLVQDPNTKMWVCPKCQDILDPWRQAARQPENITLTHPRRDEELV